MIGVQQVSITEIPQISFVPILNKACGLNLDAMIHRGTGFF
jgi:hypothetical protein